jgi:hypothetical protein
MTIFGGRPYSTFSFDLFPFTPVRLGDFAV